MDNPRNEHMPPMPSEAELRAAMDQSEADTASGHTVELAEVLHELDMVIANMKAQRNILRA